MTSLCRLSYFHLRKIASIRPYLSDASTAQLVSSPILSRLDYCSSALTGLPTSSQIQLQTVQNNPARFVLGKRKSDHFNPLHARTLSLTLTLTHTHTHTHTRETAGERETQRETEGDVLTWLEDRKEFGEY